MSPSSPTRRRSADERTDLAWNRSGLAIIGCGIIVMRGLTLNGLERFTNGLLALGLAVIDEMARAGGLG